MQRLILILVALSLGGVLTALVFLFGRYSVIPPEHLDLSNFDWGGLGTIAAFLTFFINIVLLLTVFFGFQSIREGQAARTAQVLVWATSQMDAIKEDERRLAAAPEDISDWDRQQTLSARRVTNAYQRLSYFCAHGLIPEAHIRNKGLSP